VSKNKVDQCNTTLYCDLFAYPLLPKKRNNTFPFIVVGENVATNSIKVFSVAMENSNGLPLLCCTATEYFVLLLTVISYKYYDCVCLYYCISYPEYVLRHILLCVTCVAVPYFTTLPYKRHDFHKRFVTHKKRASIFNTNLHATFLILREFSKVGLLS
jgi:hypothetical protein